MAIPNNLEHIFKEIQKPVLQQTDFINFLHAVVEGDFDFVQSFIEQNPEKINQSDSTYSIRASHLAALYNQPEILKFLIDHGAEIGQKTNEDLSEIHYGVDFPEIVEVLLTSNPELKNQRGQGFTPREICTNPDSLNYLFSTKRMRSDSSINRMFASAFVDETEEAIREISPSPSPLTANYSSFSTANKSRRLG